MVSSLVDGLHLVCDDRSFWTSISLEVKGLQPFLEMVLDHCDLCADDRAYLEHMEIDQAYDRSIQKFWAHLTQNTSRPSSHLNC